MLACRAMRRTRLPVALLLGVVYLAAAALPCPTPDLDRSRAPRAERDSKAPSGRHAHADPAPAADEPARHQNHGVRAGHAHHEHHTPHADEAPAAGHAAHHHHASHDSASSAADPDVASTHHGHHASTKSGRNHDEQLRAPCPCGCSKPKSPPSVGGRLGPALVSAWSPDAMVILAVASEALAPALPPEPFRALDPIPI